MHITNKLVTDNRHKINANAQKPIKTIISVQNTGPALFTLTI